ncbi:MAG: pseudouridine synthase [Verrucomicrobia bacterium]|nr:pseudouridine synthase [Verrucomicrobiota bacterium]
MRLNRFLAAAGLGSRRSCEELILKGSVSVNGSVARDLSTRVKEGDDVRVSGRIVHAFAPRTILLNKPAGYTTTRIDKHAERTIFDLLPSDVGHLFHVGRLDKESEGLLLLTNDGVLAQDLMHPSKGVEKEYEVILDKPFREQDAVALRKGTWIEGSVARVEAVRNVAPNKIEIILHQGLKRQIRVMLGQLGFKVQRLIRIRLGPLTLRGVKPGSYRDLREEDLLILRKALAAPRVIRPKPIVKRRPLFELIPSSAKASPSRSDKTGSDKSQRTAGKFNKPRDHGKQAKRPTRKGNLPSARSTFSAKPARKTSPTHARIRKRS